jgi:hypothetical protein
MTCRLNAGAASATPPQTGIYSLGENYMGRKISRFFRKVEMSIPWLTERKVNRLFKKTVRKNLLGLRAIGNL